MRWLLVTIVLISGCGHADAPPETEPSSPPEPTVTPEGPATSAGQPPPAEAPSPEAERLQTACDDGDARACVTLADRLEAGDGVSPDPARAHGLLEQACQSGSTLACDRLGH